MKKALVSLSIAFLLVACGDTVENVYQSGMEAYAYEDDLPKCSKDNENDVAFVKEDLSTRVCMDGEWVTSKDTVYLDGGNFSCKTVELKDKSGLKIVCNGDSIGVVLNGSDGKQGENGEPGEKGEDGNPGSGCSITDRSDTAVVIACGDSTITIDLKALQSKDSAKVDSEQVSITLDSLVGYAQKGPFLKGSTVYLYEFLDGSALGQVSGPFMSTVLRDDGCFRFPAHKFASQYALVVVEGNYRNVVSGMGSESPIRLKALVDLSSRDSVNVNVLTHLAYERVLHLVTLGDSTGKKLTVKQAKRQAQNEIMDNFNIKLEEYTDAEGMDIFGLSDADAALFAVSVLLQGDRTESDMIQLLSEISTDIAGDGLWNSDGADKKKTQMTDWVFGQDLSKFRGNVKSWHLRENDSVGNFEKKIESFIAGVYGIEVCKEQNNDVKQEIKNEWSAYNGIKLSCYNGVLADKRENPYLNKDIQYGQMIDWRNRRVYHTITLPREFRGYILDGDTWLAENLDYEYKVNGEPYGNFCGDDSCKIYGRYYTQAGALDGYKSLSFDETGRRGICPEGWLLPKKMDWDSLFSVVGDNYTYCAEWDSTHCMEYADNGECLSTGFACISEQSCSQSIDGACNKYQANDLQARDFENWPAATDKIGFSILPAAVSDLTHEKRNYATFWSAEGYGIMYFYAEEWLLIPGIPANQASVRCVQK